MDKRYIKLITDNFPYEQPKHFKRIVTVCVLVTILGVMMLFANADYALYGFALGMLGAVGMIAVGITGMVFRKKKAKEAMSEYESIGKLPEWPVSKEQIESPQPNH